MDAKKTANFAYRASIIAIGLWIYFVGMHDLYHWLDTHVSIFKPLKPECQE